MMKVERYGLIISMFVFLVHSVTGQTSVENDSTKKSELNSQAKPLILKPDQKFHFSMEVGTGFISGSKFNSGSYATFAPTFNYRVTPKLNLEVTGLLFRGSQSLYQIPASTGIQHNFSQNPNQFFFNANGKYALTEKLSLTGSMFKSLNSNQSPQINPYFLDYKGVNVGLNYKISEHIDVGAQFEYSNGLNNYLHQNGFGQYSPYQQSLYGW
jgi:hypothetical protein